MTLSRQQLTGWRREILSIAEKLNIAREEIKKAEKDLRDAENDLKLLREKAKEEENKMAKQGLERAVVDQEVQVARKLCILESRKDMFRRYVEQFKAVDQRLNQTVY